MAIRFFNCKFLISNFMAYRVDKVTGEGGEVLSETPEGDDARCGQVGCDSTRLFLRSQTNVGYVEDFFVLV